MTTKLNAPIRREIEIDGELYTVVLTARGLQFARKRFRSGRTISWRELRDEAEHARPSERKTLEPRRGN